MKRQKRCGPVVLALAIVAQQAGAQVAGTRELTVRLGDGAPAAGALVVPCREHDALPSARCDADGMVSLADASTADRVIVFDPPAIPYAVPLSPDTTEIVVPVARLAGRVLVDGAPPREPIDLQLSPSFGDVLSRIGPIPGVGQAVMRALGARTDASGAFDFGLVAATLSGSIGGPRTLTAVQPPAAPGNARAPAQQSSVHFDHPAGDLVLEFHALPVISGRIVDAEGRPVTGSRVEYELKYASGDGSGGDRVDEQARFAVPISTPGVRAVVLRLIGPTGSGRRTLTLEPVPEQGHDFGDVALEANAPLLVEVRDTEGRPLQGAIVMSADGKARSEPTGVDGRVLFRDRVSGEGFVQVAALAHETAKVAASAAPGEPVVAILQPLATLEIDVRLPDGRPAPEVVLVLSSEGKAFLTEGPPLTTYLQQQLGATSLLGSSRRAKGILPDGHAVVTGLLGGAKIQLSLVDRCGAPLCDGDVVSIGEREHVRRTWPLAKLPRDVRIEARDAQGQLVPHVHVKTDCVDAILQDEQGRCLIKNVYSDVLACELIPAPTTGLGRTERVTLPVPADGLIVVDLVPARTVTVEIVDEAGTPVDGFPRLAGFGTVSCEAQRTGPGRYEFAGLGVGDVDLTVDLCDHAWKQTVDTAQAVARFVLPATGKVRLRLDGTIPAGSPWYANFKTPKGEWAGARVLPVTGLAASDVVELGDFLPGTYQVCLTRGIAPLGSWPVSVTVSVTAGAVTELALSP